jgi:hypothetical protein
MSTILKDGGTVYFRQNNSNIEYSVIPSTWNTALFTITITNTTTPVAGNILTVLFTTDLTLSTASHYFICGSPYITFDGQNNTCIINVANYPGLIQNGSGAVIGKNYITVQNINTVGTSTLATGGGWIGCSYFGRSANNVFITNCTSSGAISGNAGGICGAYAGTSGSVTVSNCTSSGAISVNAGGICGFYAGSNRGSVTVSNCTSSGVISGNNAGGICGLFAGDNGSVSVSNCTSSGAISGSSAGGICGAYAGSFRGSATISNCYSSGIISGQNAGGICGRYAGGFNNGSASVSNCYSSGAISGVSAGGIYGANKSNTATESNTYVANGNWSSNVANNQLTGNPSVSNPGLIWAYYIVNTPYILTVFYVAPTQVDIEDGSQLQDFLQGTIEKGIIMNDIEVDFNLTSSNGFKTLFSDDTTIKITRV